MEVDESASFLTRRDGDAGTRLSPSGACYLDITLHSCLLLWCVDTQMPPLVRMQIQHILFYKKVHVQYGEPNDILADVAAQTGCLVGPCRRWCCRDPCGCTTGPSSDASKWELNLLPGLLPVWPRTPHFGQVGKGQSSIWWISTHMARYGYTHRPGVCTVLRYSSHCHLPFVDLRSPSTQGRWRAAGG